MNEKNKNKEEISVFIAYLIAIISVITMLFTILNYKKTDIVKHINEDGSFVLTKSDKVSKTFTKNTNARQYEWYSDIWCPDCIRVHEITNKYVDNAINGGEIEIKYHPLNFLSHKSKNYSLIGAAWISGTAENCDKEVVLKVMNVLYSNKKEELIKLNDIDFVKTLAKLTIESGATAKEVDKIENNLNLYKAMINSGSVNIRRMPELAEISQKEDKSFFVPFIFNVKDKKAYDGESENVNDEVLAKLKGNLNCDDCSDLKK